MKALFTAALFFDTKILIRFTNTHGAYYEKVKDMRNRTTTCSILGNNNT